MPVEDLDLILKKDPIIGTFPVASLQACPAEVEQVYATHAKTHISLGDTARYVDTIFRWVSGQNKGAFIGAVEGNYGEGKTSFLVHVWAESAARRVFAVPPFEWLGLGDAVDGVASWLNYVLGRTHPALAREAERLHEEFKQKSLEDRARDIAQKKGQDYDATLSILKAAAELGAGPDTDVPPARFLDYCAKASDVVERAGFTGLLVLMDEPEVTAKRMGIETVSFILFNMVNEILRREGNYGVFLSMPHNFLADVSRRFPALTARLQARACFPRLRDIYGSGFAKDLWQRYVSEFGLGGEGDSIVALQTLEAIGQVGSSDRGDLSFGPRTVVSAFSRMVCRYRETGQTYQPGDFVEDCLTDEIMINADYPSAVRDVLGSPDVTAENRAAILFAAAFPNGLPIETARAAGVEAALLELFRRSSLVYRTVHTLGLHRLRKRDDVVQSDPLRDAILEVNREYAADLVTSQRAIKAFALQFVPMVLQPRKGQQLLGWTPLGGGWSTSRNGAFVAGFVGAFAETQGSYPERAIIVVVSSIDDPVDSKSMPDLPETAGPQQFDAIIHFKLKWHAEQALPAERLVIKPKSPVEEKPAVIRLSLDLQNDVIEQEHLADLVGPETLTPLWLLNLLTRMESEQLPREFDAQWKALQGVILRELIPIVLSEESAALAEQQLGVPVSSTGLGLLGSIMQRVLAKRYPDYSTLIKQAQWKPKVDDYINALKNAVIPLAAKRGRERWKADGDVAARALGTSRMNLTGGAFTGFENLLTIRTAGHNAPIEVDFRIHPLEQRIAEAITADGEGGSRKGKIGGQECWYLPMSDLLPLIKQSGYTIEELKRIVEIGTSRGSYDATDYHGERVLYVRPVDLEQMRRQLLEKLSDLEAEVKEFRKLPRFVCSFDFEAARQIIAALKDEADYEKLLNRLNREFEQIHQRLPGYFDELAEGLQKLRSDASQISAALQSARELSTLATLPSGNSRWCADLSKYIVGNLRNAVGEVRNDAAQLKTTLDGHILTYVYQAGGKPSETIAHLLKGISAANDAQQLLTELKHRTQGLLGNLRDYESWLKVLRRSDEIYEELLRLERDAIHSTAARELLGEFETVCTAISDHLAVRNVQGLGAYRQFLASLDEIDEKRKAYLLRLKAEFDKRKAMVNGLIDALHLDRRVTTIFNPMDIEASYRELFELGARHIQEAGVTQGLDEIEKQTRELTYCRDILGVGDRVVVDSCLQQLADARGGVMPLLTKVSGQWLRDLTDAEYERETCELGALLKSAFDAAREAGKLVRTISAPTAPTEGRAKSLYDLIPTKDSVDLKVLVMQMLGNGVVPSAALEDSLVCLGELFRANCVHIKVERRGV